MMLSSILIFLAQAGPPAASLPTPKPLPSAVFQFPEQTFGTAHPALLWVVQALFIATAIGLVALMSVQTTKTEGLSGSIGGRTESAYRGRLGFDQQLARLTGGVAMAFVFLAVAYFFVTR